MYKKNSKHMKPKTNKTIFLLILLFSFHINLKAQLGNGTVSGNFQLNAQTYLADSTIEAPKVNEKMLTNAYANFIYTSPTISAGIRFESYQNALLGYDKRYNGSGIPYRFVSYAKNNFSFTVGNFYEQFGNGTILRAYEDKYLGIDNSFNGILVKYKALGGLQLKTLVGKQRYFFGLGNGIVRAIDGELNLKEIGLLDSSKYNLTVGASFVSKYQADEDPTYILPENVGAASLRFMLSAPQWNLNAEFAQKANDPSADNNYIYKKGNVALFNFSWSKKGLGFLLGGKLVDNMSFRSDRNANLNNLTINYLPSISNPHEYSLAGFYPYATQNLGEEGVRADVFYSFPKKSFLGGKYGTSLSINFAHVRSIAKNLRLDAYGYDLDLTKPGDEMYFQDFNIKLRKKINKNWKMKLAYYNIRYNKDVIEGVAGYGIVNAQIGVADVTYKIKARNYIRIESQFLQTKQDHGNWAYALVEYTLSPHYFVSFYDQYNIGSSNKPIKIHYPYVAAGYNREALQIQFGYGRQRQGIVCVGGVCRTVPASNGAAVQISYTF